MFVINYCQAFILSNWLSVITISYVEDTSLRTAADDSWVSVSQKSGTFISLELPIRFEMFVNVLRTFGVNILHTFINATNDFFWENVVVNKLF